MLAKRSCLAVPARLVAVAVAGTTAAGCPESPAPQTPVCDSGPDVDYTFGCIDNQGCTHLTYTTPETIQCPADGGCVNMSLPDGAPIVAMCPPGDCINASTADGVPLYYRCQPHDTSQSCYTITTYYPDGGTYEAVGNC